MPFDDAPPLDGGSRFFGNVNFDQPAPNTESSEPPPSKPPHDSTKPAYSSSFDADFTPKFEEDLSYWFRKKPKIFRRIRDLVNDVLLNPYAGIGKPEHLKYVNPSVWSRRIDHHHRLTYYIEQGVVTFLTARYHYDKRHK